MPTAPATRIIVVDNDREHLDGLVGALHQQDLSCRSFHYPEDMSDAQPSPHVRVVFTDLNLVEGDMSHDRATCYGAIGSLIVDVVRPSGPYILVLWTRHPEHAQELSDFLSEDLPAEMCPLTVAPLAKEAYLQGGLAINAHALGRAIDTVIGSVPQVAALLAWEAHVMNAAGHTVAEIGRLARLAEDTDVARGIAMLLVTMAEASAGINVERDRFGAVSRALVPVLADRVATSAQQGDRTKPQEVWRAAFGEGDVEAKLPGRVTAALNYASLMAPGEGGTGDARGAVVSLSDLPSGECYRDQLGLTKLAMVEKQFGCRKYGGAEDGVYRWMLVQTQAACDHAQGHPGSLPYYIGLDFPASRVKKGKPPFACWPSPTFLADENGEIRVLHVNARFGVSLPRDVTRHVTPLYRLREQLLGTLIYHIHSYGARPGMISFR